MSFGRVAPTDPPTYSEAAGLVVDEVEMEPLGIFGVVRLRKA